MSLPSLDLLFWLSLGLLVYTWIGYPALLFVLERLLYSPVRRKEAEPTVSILVCAHNEEEAIGAKIENLLALDYPRDKLEIVIASDGSHDRTGERVRQHAAPGVKLVEFPLRRGKPSILNDAVPTLQGEIVLLADTRQRLQPDVLRPIVPNLR